MPQKIYIRNALHCVRTGRWVMTTSRSRLIKHALGFLAAIGMVLLPVSSALAEGVAQSELIATTGQGAGRAIVSPTAQDQGTFAAEITVNIHGAAPNTTFTLVRKPDLVPDGICTGLAPNFAYIPFGETLTTSADGSGATHFHFERGAPFVSGVQFDVAFRAIGSDGTILQGDCMTVTIK